MKRYEKKLKWTLIFFIGLFALMINLSTFYIITSSLEKKHTELSQSHMEHQYQNCQQRMSVLGQQFLFLAEDSQLITGVRNSDTDMVKKKIESFLQSSQGITSLAVYVLDSGQMEYLTGEGNLRYQERNFEAAVDNGKVTGNFSGWYVLPDEEISLLFLCPIEQDDIQLGCLYVKVSLDSFMADFTEKKDYDLWDEHMAIVTDKIVWCDDYGYWDSMEKDWWEQKDEFRKEGKTILSSRELTNNGERLVQALVLKTDKLYVKVALGLFVIFLFGTILIYFTISKMLGNIIGKLQGLKEKMSKVQK